MKIRLFCLSGLSTNILVGKMKKAATEKGIDIEIDAFSEDKMLEYIDGVDVALLGPQVKYALQNAKKIYESKKVPVAVIPASDFGMMDGEKILNFALNLVGNRHKIC